MGRKLIERYDVIHQKGGKRQYIIIGLCRDTQVDEWDLLFSWNRITIKLRLFANLLLQE